MASFIVSLLRADVSLSPCIVHSMLDGHVRGHVRDTHASRRLSKFSPECSPAPLLVCPQRDSHSHSSPSPSINTGFVSLDQLREVQDRLNTAIIGIEYDSLIAAIHLNDAAPHKTMIDVGANKGIVSLEFMLLWCMGASRLQLQFFPETEDTHSIESRDSCPLKIFAFEPIPNNFKFADGLFHKLDLKASVDLEMAGVSNVDAELVFITGTGQMDKGDEQASLNANMLKQEGWKALPPVPVYKLDTLAKRHHWSEIHLMKLDGEGYDPLMLWGAQLSLKAHIYRLIIFEYGEKWRLHPEYDESKHTLKAVSSMLESLGYDVFLVGDRELHQLTRGLWNDRYEFFQWSNVFAMSRLLPADYRVRLLTVYNHELPIVRPLDLTEEQLKEKDEARQRLN